MKNGLCKVCGWKLFDAPLLRYPNMPGVAQHLPDAQTAALDRGIDLELRQCSGCGLAQLDCDPVDYYREVIRAAAVSQEMRAFRLGQFRDFLEQNSLRGKKVVEIGCGQGEYLSLFMEAGAQAYGLEWGADGVAACAAGGLRVERGFVDSPDYRIPGAPFDAFAILSFFEHLPEPCGVLQGIANNLAPGAIGLVEVPNFDMILRERLFAEFMRDHLFYFTRRTLATALEINGFEVVEIREVWKGYILSAVVRKRQQLDLADFAGHREKLRADYESFRRRFEKIAAWGAGHQAFALMALLNLGGTLCYVVDSAPFKQGKLTPVTHIPIVAPETLLTDPVDAVVVMAGSYSDEIVRTLREKFGGVALAVQREWGLETLD